jgi:GNAT superfamily N-acetyltransferase
MDHRLGVTHAQEILGACEENLRAYILAPQGRPWAEVGDEDDVSWLRTGLSWGWCNSVAVARFEKSTADERIEAVLAPYRNRQIRLTWFVGPTSTPADLVDRLAAHGLESSPAEPGMACELSDWPAPRAPAELTVERVLDGKAFHEWCNVFVQGMEAPAEGQAAFEELFGDVAVGEQAPIRAYLARQSGKPIACGFGVPDRGVVGIYAVATLPEARRQGAGGVVTARIMDDARRAGARLAVLQSSEMGFPLYQRLGFRTVCEMRVVAGTP